MDPADARTTIHFIKKKRTRIRMQFDELQPCEED
jgi:hypothetical protein